MNASSPLAACTATLLLLLAGCSSTSPAKTSNAADTSAGDDASTTEDVTTTTVLPNRPAMAITVPTYSKTALAAPYCATRFDLLKTEGFKMVTITPSFAYNGPGTAGASGGPPPIVDDSMVPPAADLTECIGEAYTRGLAVAFKPHLDGGDRGTYDFDPAADTTYFNIVLKPFVDAFASFQTAKSCQDCTFVLYLGTELRTSVGKYPASWSAILQQTRDYVTTKNLPLAPHMTIDLLFDFPYAVTANAQIGTFFDGLDSFSLSQYTPLNAETPDGGTTTNAEVTATLKQYDYTLRAYFHKLGMANASTITVNYGEFGISTDGLAEPWGYDAPISQFDPNQVTVGIEGMLDFLRTKTNSPTMKWSNLWTVGLGYDVMGNDVGPDGGLGGLGGPAVVPAKDAIEAYNAGE